MKRLALATALAGVATIQLATSTAGSDVSSYVAVDADRDGRISVGDTLGWNVDGPNTITLRCWADDTKGKPVQTFTSPPYSPKVRYEPTGKSVVLLAPGYCESAGSNGGLHWFTVAPYERPGYTTYP